MGVGAVAVFKNVWKGGELAFKMLEAAAQGAFAVIVAGYAKLIEYSPWHSDTEVQEAAQWAADIADAAEKNLRFKTWFYKMLLMR